MVQTPTRQNLGRLDMISPTRGWAFSYDGLILEYNGIKWEIADSLQNLDQWKGVSDTLNTSLKNLGDIYAIRMIDKNRGWLAVNNPDTRIYLLFSFRNGKWTPIPDPFPVKIRAMDFSDQVGYAIGQRGVMRFEENQWQVEQIPVTSNFRAVQITDSGTVWVCGGYGTLLRFQDRWENIPVPASVLLRDLDFITEDLGWIVGNNGALWKYFRGNIEQVQNVTLENLWAIDMTDSLTGWAVGEKGTILFCREGEWRLFESPTNADLHDIEMVSPFEGWIVGAWGNILHYTIEEEAVQHGKPHQFQFVGQVHLGSDYLMDRINDVNGVLSADFDGNLLPDIYLTCMRSLNHLLLNQGGGYYQDFVIESGTGGSIENRVGHQLYERGALAADFDRDGNTDIFLFGNSGTLRYFRNTGHAVFNDLTRQTGIPLDYSVQAAVIGDPNEDGYPDILLAEVQEGAILLQNRKYNRFSARSIYPKDVAVFDIQTLLHGDLNNDHHQDLLLVFSDRRLVFLRNDGKANFTVDNSWQHPPVRSAFINSLSFFDADNDGDNDLFFCTEDGKDALWINESEQEAVKFADRSGNWKILQEGRSYSAVPGDFDHDGDIDLYLSRFGKDVLYINKGELFENEAEHKIYSKAKFNSGFNTGAAALDIDGDGDLDLVVGNRDYWSSLLQNTQNDSNFLTLQLIGVRSNREAVGARVWFYRSGYPRLAEHLLGFREVGGGSGFFSQNSPLVHLGLGKSDTVDAVVRFPGGGVRVLNGVTAGSHLMVYENDGLVRTGFDLARFSLRVWHTPSVRLGLFKFFLFALLAILSVRFFEKRYRWRASHTALYMITLMGLYGIFTIATPVAQMGWGHLLPFALILLIIATLVSFNEQNLKSNLKKFNLQKKFDEASARISNATLIEPIIDVVADTFRTLAPTRQILIFLYNEAGNFFSLKKAYGLKIQADMRVIKLKRSQLRKLARNPNPVKDYSFLEVPGITDREEDFTLYPVVNRNEVQGIIFHKLQPESGQLEHEIQEFLLALCVQFASAIRNLRILQQMDDQKKMVAIGTFAGGIIHDLKNPIDGLRLITEVLYHETPPEDPRFEYVKELYEGILTLKRDLLNSFNIVRRNASEQTPFDLNDLIKKITQVNGLPIQPIRLQLEEGLPQILGNELQIKYALENIIQNAYEAAGANGSIRIRTTYRKRQKQVSVEIKDNGKGMRADQLEKVFNIFYSTKGHGRGMGLTLTRNIIEDHGGKIFIDSQENRGTMVKIILPQKSTDGK
ncbi:MAG: hypothetical protein Kow0042_24800 [Calditrichia bacterium]